MKVFHRNFYVNPDGALSDDFSVDAGAVIDVAQFDHFPNNRKQRRVLQSDAARQLLEHSLEQHFPRNANDAWHLNKLENGKPFLMGAHAPSISITHRGDWCATAMSATSIVGIDVEIIKHHDWEMFSSTVFHPDETRWVLKATERERDIRGLICWCRKEAFLKALGLGMTVNLSEIGFSDTGVLIAFPGGVSDYIGWRFLTTIICNTAMIAVALKG